MQQGARRCAARIVERGSPDGQPGHLFPGRSQAALVENPLVEQGIITLPDHIACLLIQAQLSARAPGDCGQRQIVSCRPKAAGRHDDTGSPVQGCSQSCCDALEIIAQRRLPNHQSAHCGDFFAQPVTVRILDVTIEDFIADDEHFDGYGLLHGNLLSGSPPSKDRTSAISCCRPVV